MKNSMFRILSAAEKKEKLERILRTKTEDTLTAAERKAILASVSPDKQYAIRVFTDVQAFEQAITLRQVHTLIGEIEKRTVTRGQTVFGDFRFGESVLKTDTLKRESGKIHKAELFDTEESAAAVLETRNIGYDDLNVLMNVDEIVLYIPSERMEGTKNGNDRLCRKAG